MRKFIAPLLVIIAFGAWGCLVPDVSLAGKACGDAGAGVSHPCAEGYVCQGAATNPLAVGTCVPADFDGGPGDGG